MNRIQRVIARLAGIKNTNSYGGTLFNTAGGTIGRNSNLRWDKFGASLAVTVNEALARCVQVRTDNVGSTAWQIIDNDTEEVIASSADIDTANPLARAIIRYQQREQESLFARWERSRCIAGETYIELAKNDYEFPADLEWYNPLGMWIEAPRGIPTAYHYNLYSNSATFYPDNMVYDRVSSNLRDEIYGYSPVMTAIGSLTTDIVRNSQRVLSAFFINNATPSGIITPKANADSADMGNTGWSAQQTARMREQFEIDHLGVDKSWKTTILPFPIEYLYQELPDLQKWADLIRSIEPKIYTVMGIARSFAGDSDSTAYQASPDDKPNSYATIMTELKAIEAIVNGRFIPFFTGTRSRPPYRFEFDYSRFELITPENANIANQSYRSGAITLNEYRAKIGEKAIDGGDLLLIDSTYLLTPVDKLTASAPTALPSPQAPTVPTSDAQGVNLSAIETAFRNGALTLNQYLSRLGFEPVQNGDVYYMPSGAVVVPSDLLGTLQSKPTYLPFQSPQTTIQQAGDMADDAGFDTPTRPPVSENLPSETPIAVEEAITKAVPEKYSHIDFSPTTAMKEEARRGLEWRREFGRGGQEEGVARARDISNGRNLSPDTVKRMFSFFSRHEGNKQAEGFEPGEDGYPSASRIAWALWGGDAGFSWSRARRNQMETADNAEKSAELKAWYRKHQSKGAKALDFEPNVIPDEDASEIRYCLANGDDSVFKRFRAIYDETPERYENERIEALVASYRAMLKEAHDTLGVHADGDAVKAFHLNLIRAKSIQSTRLNFERGIEDLFDGALGGNVNKRTFKMRLFALIRGWGYQAYKDGLKVGGVDVVDLDGDDLSDYERFLEEQRQYVDSVAEAIYTDDKVTPAEAEGKPLMWSNKSLMPFYYMGVESSAGNGAFEWVLGRTDVHCKSCKALDGQRRRMKYWQSTIMPQSSGLSCKGFNCKCLLIKTDMSVSLGRLPNWG